MLKVGLVGYGFMGKMHSQCYGATGKANVVAVADVEQDRREDAKAKLSCKTYSDINAMLSAEELDIVDICTPTYLHEECVIAAARAGKDLMCEKPLSLTVDSCDKMIAEVDKAGVKMMVGQVIRFWPEYAVVKDIVDSGKYGNILWISASRLSPPATWAWQGWLFDPKLSGGAIHDLHIHDIDYISYLLGLPEKVQCRGICNQNGGIDSALSMGWGYANGASTYAEGTLALAPTYPFTMSLLISMEKATIKLDSSLSPSLVVYPVDGKSYAPELPKVEVGASSETSGNVSSLGGYFLEINYFVDCVLAGKKPEIVTPKDAREAVRVCIALKESAEKGETIKL